MKHFIILSFLLLFFLGCSKDSSNPVESTPTTPVVQIFSPVNNSTIIDTATIDISASDDKGIVKVEVLVDNLVVKTFSVPPFKYIWDTSLLADSSQHSVFAKAYDGDNNTSSSSVITVTINRLAPSNLTLVELTDKQVSLKWKDNSKIESSYVIEMKTDSINYSTIGEFPPNTTVAVISHSFTYGNKYYFRVGAKVNNIIKYSNTVFQELVVLNKIDPPIPTFSGTVDGVVAAIQFSYTLPSVPPPYNTISMDMGYANFGNGTDAGAVTVNGKNIAKITSGNTVYYNSFASTDPLNPPTPLNLNWNGDNHTWSVAGAGTTPAFTLDVTSPTTFTLSNPTTSTVAPKTSNLTVTWSNASGNSSDSVMIVLVPMSGSGTAFTATTTNKTGSYTIPSSSLSGFSGDAMLELVKYRYAMKTVSGKTYVGVAEIVNTVSFKIQ